MQQLKLEILEKGDQVLNFSENRIAVKKKSGELEVFTLIIDHDSQLPRIADKSILITFGKKHVKKATIKDENTNFEIGTF